MATLRTRLYKPILILIGIVLFVSVSFSQRSLNASRERLGLTRVTPLENAPPVLAFTTVALGGFRGLIANALWIRLNDLQEEDKYFEMVQLADWITKLQPHFTTVWIHLAWNMSYNISIKFNDPHDRWMWVSRGIELLRDEGLRYNPKEPLLYRELAWHFQHKIGQNLDDAHNYYKQAWAQEMNQVLGGGHPNFDELLHPVTEDAKARVKLLREKYKMDPQRMKEVDAEYGPLEWRLPETHAIYWAYVGLEFTKGETIKKDDFVKLRRVIFQSMQLAFMRGRMIYTNKEKGEFTTAPNLDIVERTSKTYEEMMELEPNMRENIQNAHKNFLRTAVYFLYSYSRLSAANRWFAYVKEKYPGSIQDGQNLDDFALSKVTEDIGETSHDRVEAILGGLLEQAFWHLAIGDDEPAVNFERFARRIWQRYTDQLKVQTQLVRVGLPPLAELKKNILDRMLDPTNGLEPQLAAQLRTKLALPPPSTNTVSTPSASNALQPTNSVSVSTNAPAKR